MGDDWPHDELGPVDAVRECPSGGQRDGQIAFPGEDERRDVDCLEPPRSRRFEADLEVVEVGPPRGDLEGPALHHADGRTDRRDHLGRSPVRSVHPGPEVRLDGGVEVAPFERVALLAPEPAQVLRWLVQERAGRADEEKRRGELRSGEGDLGGHTRAERAADEVRGSGVQLVEQGGNVGVVGERLGRPQIRLAEPAQIDADRPPARRERLPLRLPHPPVAHAGVDEHDRRDAGATVVGSPTSSAGRDRSDR